MILSVVFCLELPPAHISICFTFHRHPESPISFHRTPLFPLTICHNFTVTLTADSQLLELPMCCHLQHGVNSPDLSHARSSCTGHTQAGQRAPPVIKFQCSTHAEKVRSEIMLSTSRGHIAKTSTTWHSLSTTRVFCVGCNACVHLPDQFVLPLNDKAAFFELVRQHFKPSQLLWMHSCAPIRG